MSNIEDQSTRPDNWTICLGSRGNPISLRFPPQPSISDISFPFPIASVDIPLSAYQFSTDFHAISLTAATPAFIFVADAVKIMEQQQFRISFSSIFDMPQSNDLENLPGTSGTSTSSIPTQMNENTGSRDENAGDQQEDQHQAAADHPEAEAGEEVAQPSISPTKKREKLVNRVAPMLIASPPAQSPEEEARLERPQPRGRQEANPRIRVLRAKFADYASLPVKFVVEVLDPPQDLNLTSTMIDAVVRSPYRNTIPCTIGPESETFKRGRMLVFKGSFEATEETGAYRLQARLVLPMTVYRAGYGVMGDEVNIVVMRNYVRDGLQFTGPVFQLPFKQQGRRLPLEDGLDIAGGRAVLKAWGLACDKPTNRLYYTDCVGNTVNCVNPGDGSILFEFQGHSSFNHPMGIVVDEVNRRVLVCDKDNHRICIFTVGGHFVRSMGEFGYDDGMFNYPWDVAVNSSGSRFAVTDTENKRVQLFDQFGNFVNSFSVFAMNPFISRNQFDCPRGIVFGNQGKCIFVTDFTTKNVVQIPLNFMSYHRTAPECEFHQLHGLAFDEFSTLLVADSEHNCVCQMTLCGKLLGKIRRVGQNLLQNPVNVVIMEGGSVAVLEASGKLYII